MSIEILLQVVALHPWARFHLQHHMELALNTVGCGPDIKLRFKIIKNCAKTADPQNPVAAMLVTDLHRIGTSPSRMRMSLLKNPGYAGFVTEISRLAEL